MFRGPPEAFAAALLMTGDQKYAAVMRRQIDNLFAAKKVENGKDVLPRRFGDQGWYDFYELGAGPSGTLGNLVNVMVSIYMWSLQPADLARVPLLPGDRNAQMDTPAGTEWLAYLKSGDKDYPLRVLQAGLDAVRRAAAPAPAAGATRRPRRGCGRSRQRPRRRPTRPPRRRPDERTRDIARGDCRRSAGGPARRWWWRSRRRRGRCGGLCRAADAVATTARRLSRR